MAAIALPANAASVMLLRSSHSSIAPRTPVARLRPGRATRGPRWRAQEAAAFLSQFESTIREFRPRILWTYGGDLVTRRIIGIARQHGLVVVFGLHNFAYHDASAFAHVDHIFVPSEFSRRWYRERLGLNCHVLPNVIDWNRVLIRKDPNAKSAEPERAPHPSPLPEGERENTAVGTCERELEKRMTEQSYVTFVNPVPAKGVFVFARIAEQIARRRPDIPILVVESRGRASWLERIPLDLSWATNLYAMENTPDPRDFYKVTRLLLVPSLWNESFGLVAAEAMVNGIPVLGSTRGALPEIVGNAGFLFDIPSCYTPESSSVPTVEEAEPWTETVINLWDNDQLYESYGEKAREQGRRWHPDQLGPVYMGYFRSLKPAMRS